MPKICFCCTGLCTGYANVELCTRAVLWALMPFLLLLRWLEQDTLTALCQHAWGGGKQVATVAVTRHGG